MRDARRRSGGFATGETRRTLRAAVRALLAAALDSRLSYGVALTSKPCLDCSRIFSGRGSYCPDCRKARERARSRRRDRTEPQRAIRRSARWQRARRTALNAAGWRCEHVDERAGRCRARHGLDVDHKVAIVDGGDPYDPDNLEALCRKHHRRKETGYAREKRSGDRGQSSKGPIGDGALRAEADRRLEGRK